MIMMWLQYYHMLNKSKHQVKTPCQNTHLHLRLPEIYSLVRLEKYGQFVVIELILYVQDIHFGTLLSNNISNMLYR